MRQPIATLSGFFFCMMAQSPNNNALFYSKWHLIKIAYYDYDYDYNMLNFRALVGRETRNPYEPEEIQQPGLKKTGLP